MSDLLNHIQALNEQTRAWVAEDPNNRWAGMIVEDLDHWAEMGVHTVEQYEMFMMRATISDLHKDVYGFRPHGLNVGEMSMEELSTMYDRLLNELERQQEAEAEYEKQMEKELLEDQRMSNLESDPEPTRYELMAEQFVDLEL